MTQGTSWEGAQHHSREGERGRGSWIPRGEAGLETPSMSSLPTPVDVGGWGTLPPWEPGLRTAGCLSRGGGRCLPSTLLGEPRHRQVPSLPAWKLLESPCPGTCSAQSDSTGHHPPAMKTGSLLPLAPSTHSLASKERQQVRGRGSPFQPFWIVNNKDNITMAPLPPWWYPRRAPTGGEGPRSPSPAAC